MRSALLSLVLVGCASTSPWPAIAEQADESGLWVASETALLVVPGNLSPRATPTLTAEDAVMTAWVPFAPNDCVVATSHYGTVTYTLDDCSGSFGLVHASGHLVVEYMEASPTGELVFHASSDDLVLNGGAVQFEADASVAHDTTMGIRTITLTIDTTGTGPDGTLFVRHGTQTARWSDTWGCLFVDTSDDTLTVEGTPWQAEARGLSLCVGECPETGGTMTWTGAPGRVQIGYDGSRIARWSVQGQPNEAGSLPLSCGI
jgi:hypothetical protein